MPRKKITPDSPASSEPKVASGRKVEITGILLMVVAVLIAISILSYESFDFAVIADSDVRSVLSPDAQLNARIGNHLGVLGAYLSHYLVYGLFGFSSIVIPLILFQFGWHTFRHKWLGDLQWSAVLSVSGMILAAAFLGWITIVFDLDNDALSGMAGLGIASFMLNLTGKAGSVILLTSFLLILALLFIDRDIQASIDRFRDWIARVRAWLEDFSAKRQEARALKAAEREAVREQREAERRERASARERNKAEQAEDERAGRADGTPAGTAATAVKGGTSTLAGKAGAVVDGVSGGAHSDGDRRDADVQAEVAEAGPAAMTPEERIKESTRRDRERRAESEAEWTGKTMPDRAVLENEKAPAVSPSSDDDLKITVSVGEEEEQARARDLEKAQKEHDIPVIKYKFPTIDLLDSPPAEGNEVDFDEINENKLIILDKLKRHGIEILGIEAVVGPTVTLYELQPAPDVKISKIESYANDLKMAMATHGLRIIAPIPGKSAVGIEVPNRKRETVFIKQLINTKKFVETRMHLPVAFGKTIENEVYMVDLTAMPHLLIAGATGSGKSVGINTIITCLLYKCHPENLKFVLVDPKKIELALYQYLKRHFLATLPDAEEPIITDTSKVMEALSSVVKEMDERYDLLKMAMVRDLRAYNEKFKAGQLETDLGHKHLPYIVVIIDELADLMMTAGKAIEEPIARIAQLARAVGIHLVVATQRPSVNVITGTIKANFPVRIAYQVASKIDSRTILDTMGADQLVGRGDMLISHGGRMVRVQNAFVSTEEVERINAFIGNQLGYNNPYILPQVEDPDAHDSGIPELDDRDDLFEEAAKVVVLHQQGSVSLIQRKLKLGYNRAGRIIDQLFAAGIVGPYQGSTAREVLIADEDELYEHLRNLDLD